jgi:hypothetical protein
VSRRPASVGAPRRGHSGSLPRGSRRFTAPGPALLLSGAPDALIDKLPW